MVIRLDSNGNPWYREHPTLQDMNNTNTELQTISMVGIAQNAYQTLQANNVFENKDFLVTDEMTDSTGTNNTVNTSSTTAIYDSGYILGFTDEASGDTTSDADSYTNPENAFDSDSATYAEKSVVTTGTTYRLGKTFSSKFVGTIHYKTSNISTNINADITLTLQKYTSSTWSDIATISTNTGNITIDNDEYFVLDETVEGLAILMTNSGGDTSTARICRIYDLEYGDYDLSSTVVCDTGTLTLLGTEDTICVYADKTLPTGTSITVDISDGTTTLSSQSFNTPIGISTLIASAELELTFNLITTDTTATPLLKGYGVYIK